MNKNLILVFAMEEKGFDVTFSGGMILMHPMELPSGSMRMQHKPEERYQKYKVL